MSLEHLLISAYTKRIRAKLEEASSQKVNLGPRDQEFLAKVSQLGNSFRNYTGEQLDIALDTIDLPDIYEGVDKREKEQSNGLEYEDFLVQEVLRYFKSFFKWVTKPQCTVCNQDGDNIIAIGRSRPPAHNPSDISIIENYRCTTCSLTVDFPRINNPLYLLQTRKGRCGEWVNCFMLILQAVLGTDGKLRYVWNHEDHVWCEYYSRSMKRWVHLDPCEGVFDEPNLYVDNWGKKMSWVVGVNDGYVVDLTEKYVTNKEKRILKGSVVDNVRGVEKTIKKLAYKMLLRREDLYDWWVLYRRERIGVGATNSVESETGTSTEGKGRQTGGGEWTRSRGEDGG